MVVNVVLGAELGLVENDVALVSEVVDREDRERDVGFHVNQIEISCRKHARHYNCLQRR